MISINARGLLVVGAAVIIALYMLGRAKQPRSQDTYETRHGACAQADVRNHSGVEPNNPFGLCHSDRDDYAGRDLPSEGRRR
jgi:hypothetical protein